MNPSYVMALLGGVLIATAVTLMLLFNGRVTGISGIVRGLLKNQKGDRKWRVAFLFGLFLGGLLLSMKSPELFVSQSGRTLPLIGLGGLLVGVGTAMANGCTSGHGVCGISRFSPRSLIATLVFMSFGILVVTLLEKVFGL